MSLRYNDLVFIDLFVGLLRRNWLESDLHHVCLFSVQCLLCLCFAGLVKLVSSTEPGRLYSGGAGSPPGLSDLRRASSLTNKHCVGLEEKPPRRCHNKSPSPGTTWKCNKKMTFFGLFAKHINIKYYFILFRTHKKHLIYLKFILDYTVLLFWRQVPDMVVLSVFYLKLHLLFSTVFPTLSSGNVGMFQTPSQLLHCSKVSSRSLLLVIIMATIKIGIITFLHQACDALSTGHCVLYTMCYRIMCALV